jgi:hypothetical protein
MRAVRWSISRWRILRPSIDGTITRNMIIPR